MTPKDESPRSEGVQYVTMEEQTINSPRKNDVAWPKQKRPSVVDVSSYESKIWCCKEQYCIGIWSVRSMNQCKLDVVKQEMARININMLQISELNQLLVDPKNKFIYLIKVLLWLKKKKKKPGTTVLGTFWKLNFQYYSSIFLLLKCEN